MIECVQIDCVQIDNEIYEEIGSSEHLATEVLNEMGTHFDIWVGDHVTPEGYVRERGGVLIRASHEDFVTMDYLLVAPKVTALRMAESGSEYEEISDWIHDAEFVGDDWLKVKAYTHSWGAKRRRRGAHINYSANMSPDTLNYFEIRSAQKITDRQVYFEKLKMQQLAEADRFDQEAATTLGDLHALTRDELKEIIRSEARAMFVQQAA